jgi:hypothetical protein
MSDQTTTEQLPETEGPTGEYRRLAEHPDLIEGMTDTQLLDHFIGTRLMIEVNDNPFSAATNQVRMGYVFTVARLERAEILRRMKA